MNNRQKRLYIIITCFIASMLLAAWPVSAAGDPLTVGVPADRCPVFYIDDNTGEVTGIGVDLMRIAAEESGYDATFKVVKEKNLKDALDNDEYDVILPFGSAVKSTSGNAIIVSDNLLQTPFTLVTRGEKDLSALNELRVGMLSSLSAGADTVKQLYPGIEIVMYDTMDESVKALRKGEVDALLHNSFVWSYVLQKPSYNDLSVHSTAMFSMDFRAGTLNNDKGKAVIERLNGGIAKISDTHRQAIILDYTSRDLYKYDLSDYILKYGLAIFLAIVLLALIGVIIYQRMREVKLEHEEKLRQMIDHDPLTGLLSMSGFRKRVNALLREYPDSPYFLSL